MFAIGHCQQRFFIKMFATGHCQQRLIHEQDLCSNLQPSNPCLLTQAPLHSHCLRWEVKIFVANLHHFTTWLLTIFVTKTTNLFEVILLTRLMVTRLSTNSMMVRDRVTQLPGQAVEACHQAQDRLSLAEERPNTTGSSLAAREKHSDKHTSLSLLPESQDCF